VWIVLIYIPSTLVKNCSISEGCFDDSPVQIKLVLKPPQLRNVRTGANQLSGDKGAGLQWEVFFKASPFLGENISF